MQTKIHPPEKLIVLLSMIYMSLFFASITVAYKIVAFGHELYCASILIFPLLFPFSDALSEIYGAKIAKSMIWYTVICEAIFVLLTNVAILLPSPPNWHHQAEYNFIIGGYKQVLMANAVALLVSFYLNVFLLNKWRVLLKGKFYYLRSLGATAIGEITYTLITNVIAYFGVLSWSEISNVIISDYIVKLIYSAIIAYPAALLVAYIKIKYSSESYSANFNPFSYRSINKVVDLSSYTRKKIFKSHDPVTDEPAK
jgi:uncharacterized integral membrane protein (TIGR00697 family)